MENENDQPTLLVTSESVETPATETQLEESTEELQTVAERILERTEELCQSRQLSQDQMSQILSEVQNLRTEQTNNRERLNQIWDRLESLQSTRSDSVTPETTPPTEQLESTPDNPGDAVDPQEVETKPEASGAPPKRRKKFRAI